MAGGPILTGDIGGTKTALAYYADGELVHARRYASTGWADLTDIVRDFLARHDERPRRACFGVAGPVVDNAAKTTNLPWTVEAGELADVLDGAPVMLINDLEAVAHGLAVAGDEAFVTLNAGTGHDEGNRAVIAAGTGLGQAGLFWDGRRHHPFASEGGHASFAPRNDREVALLRFLAAEYGHVSAERVLSGPGLYNVYRFVRTEGRFEEPAWLSERLAAEDPSAVVSECALDGRSPLCRESLRFFASLYGAEAGNLALKTLATGGVFVAGGIAPKVLPALTDGVFLEGFVSKGRMRPLLEAMPVRVVAHPHLALLGAAHAAVADHG
ncbi:MAG: glucokinase [Acidobacteriota bacterium]